MAAQKIPTGRNHPVPKGMSSARKVAPTKVTEGVGKKASNNKMAKKSTGGSQRGKR